MKIFKIEYLEVGSVGVVIVGNIGGEYVIYTLPAKARSLRRLVYWIYLRVRLALGSGEVWQQLLNGKKI